MEGRRPVGDVDITRRQAAELLACHPDSVTRQLADGLASAVVAWGGRGKEMTFSKWMVLRWERARKCQRRPCAECWTVRSDAETLAEHLLEERHGCFERCGEECGYQGDICAPCAGVPL